MRYKHFIAALAAAFLLCVSSISAQNGDKSLSMRKAKSIIHKNTQRAYQMATDNQFNNEQLKYFIEYVNKKEAPFAIINGLLNAYWAQLSLDEKLDFEHTQFVEAYFYPNQWYENGVYFPPSFAYLLDNQTAYKKAWPPAFYQQHFDDNILAPLRYIKTSKGINPQSLDLNQHEELNRYRKIVRNKAADYEPRLLAYFACYRVHYFSEDTAAYQTVLNEYLNLYETAPVELYKAAEAVIKNQPTDQKQLRQALSWVDKAFSIDKDIRFKICKAHLHHLLGEKETAQTLIVYCRENLFLTDELIFDYLEEIETIINKK